MKLKIFLMTVTLISQTAFANEVLVLTPLEVSQKIKADLASIPDKKMIKENLFEFSGKDFKGGDCQVIAGQGDGGVRYFIAYVNTASAPGIALRAMSDRDDKTVEVTDSLNDTTYVVKEWREDNVHFYVTSIKISKSADGLLVETTDASIKPARRAHATCLLSLH